MLAIMPHPMGQAENTQEEIPGFLAPQRDGKQGAGRDWFARDPRLAGGNEGTLRSGYAL